MSSREFVEWLAYYELEPFGPMRDNIHSGQIASLIYNSNRQRSKPALGPSDFLLKDQVAQKDEGTKNFLSLIRAAAEEKVH
jgi:hypothetical protein